MSLLCHATTTKQAQTQRSCSQKNLVAFVRRVTSACAWRCLNLQGPSLARRLACPAGARPRGSRAGGRRGSHGSAVALMTRWVRGSCRGDCQSCWHAGAHRASAGTRTARATPRPRHAHVMRAISGAATSEDRRCVPAIGRALWCPALTAELDGVTCVKGRLPRCLGTRGAPVATTPMQGHVMQGCAQARGDGATAVAAAALFCGAEQRAGGPLRSRL